MIVDLAVNFSSPRLYPIIRTLHETGLFAGLDLASPGKSLGNDNTCPLGRNLLLTLCRFEVLWVSCRDETQPQYMIRAPARQFFIRVTTWPLYQDFPWTSCHTSLVVDPLPHLDGLATSKKGFGTQERLGSDSSMSSNQFSLSFRPSLGAEPK